MPAKNGHGADDGFLFDAEDIFARDKPVEEIVRVPEWRKPDDTDDPKVIVRSFRDGLERQAFEAHGLNEHLKPTDDDYFRQEWWSKQRRYELVARCVVRRDGSPVFTFDQVQRLAGMQPKPIERLFQAASRVNGYDAEDLKRTGGPKSPDLVWSGGDSRTALPLPSGSHTLLDSSAS